MKGSPAGSRGLESHPRERLLVGAGERTKTEPLVYGRLRLLPIFEAKEHVVVHVANYLIELRDRIFRDVSRSCRSGSCLTFGRRLNALARSTPAGYATLAGPPAYVLGLDNPDADDLGHDVASLPRLLLAGLQEPAVVGSMVRVAGA